MWKLPLSVMIALGACHGAPSNVTSAPRSCAGETVAVVTNDGSVSLDVYNGSRNLGTVRRGSSERFVLTSGGGVSVRIPAGTALPPVSRDRSRVRYICG